jgi:type II secretory pathway pseudopilin PulG
MTRLRGQDGFTMVETLVAFLLLVIGVLAVFQLIDTSRRATLRAEESQAINDIGQRELEQVRSLDYGEVALSATPPASSDPNHPGYRLSGTAPNAKFHLSKGSPDPANDPVLVQNGGTNADGSAVDGEVAPSTPFTAGDVSGTVYRYVVWQNDPRCLTCAGTTKDYKRVIVAVKITKAPSATFERSYQEFQTDIIDPDAGPLTSGSGATGNLTTAQQFWLTDDSCQGTGEPDANARVPGDSSTNNTTGTCTGSSRPDALISEAPPDPDANDPNNPAVGDYATDLEPGGTATTRDAGLQMLSQEGCNSSPSSSAANRIHWWATKRLVAGSGGAFVAAGDSTLELWTRTIPGPNGEAVNVPGSVCIYLRERPVNLLFLELTPVPIQILSISSPTSGFTCQVVSAVNGIGKCSAVNWPSGSWTKLRIKLATNTLSLGLNSRIELGISVDGTTSESLEFLYDHPTYDSRYEIITTTPL